MRQLAVTEHRQRKGIGSTLVVFSETYAKDLDFKEIILDARKTAIPFYERLGYKTQGEPFIQVTIPHMFMSKGLPKDGAQTGKDR